MVNRTKIKKQIFYLLPATYYLLSVILLRPAYCLGTPPPRHPYYIRVAVVEGKDSLQLTIRSAYQIRALNTDELLIEGKSLWKKKVIPISSGIKIGGSNFDTYGVKIQPQKDATIYINKRRFRGSMDIIRTEENKLLVVNHVDIEDYIYGVLYHEVSPYWPKEALKAQAIAARSFALYQSKLNRATDYDLTSTVYSQLYGGRTSERYRTNRVVNQTQGKILFYKGSPFPTYYHATCGGHTERANRIWNINIPPLKGVVCPYCKKSPHFLWKRKIPLSDIEAKLSKQRKTVGKISSITSSARDESGRIIDLRISGSQGTISIPAHKFRLIVGPNLIRSTNFIVTITPDRKALFSGFGWGHGVGLCQWGAYFMAKQRYSADEILKFYYPGAEIKDFRE